MCRACWAEGRAMVTMEASSTTISWATAMTARAAQRLGSASRGLSCVGGPTGSATAVVMGSPWGDGGGCGRGGGCGVLRINRGTPRGAQVGRRPPTRRWYRCGGSAAEEGDDDVVHHVEDELRVDLATAHGHTIEEKCRADLVGHL